MPRMAPGKASLRSKDPTTGQNDATRAIDRRAENGSAPRRTARGFVDVRAKPEVAAPEQKPKAVMRNSDLAWKGSPREEFGALDTAKVETLDRTDNKSDSAVMK